MTKVLKHQNSPEARASHAYQEAIDYLFRLQRVGIKLGLDNIRTLLAEIGDPQLQFPAIHIAGTNGKGSTAAIITAILRAEGYKVGLFTSPHLIDFCERIQINGIPIGRKAVVNFTNRMRPLIESLSPSFFEVNTAMAFLEFAEQKIDVAVVETGMGGRLDSTNVVQSLVTTITPIALDHQEYLGDTLKAIAGEKAGIIKKGVDCVTAPQPGPALEALREECEKKGSSLTICYDNSQYRVHKRSLAGTQFDLNISKYTLIDAFLSLPGDYQLENARLALETLSKISHHFSVSTESIRHGLKSAKWPGRLDLINEHPPVIVDVSHNPAGFTIALDTIQKHYPDTNVNAIVFLQKDKDYRAIAEQLAANAINCYVLDLPFGKPLAGETLAEHIIDSEGKATRIANLSDAFDLIKKPGNDDNVWLFIGSHYLAGHVYSHWHQY